MKFPQQRRKEECSATITQTLGLILVFSTAFAFLPLFSQPAWWSTRGTVVAPQVVTNSGVVTTNYVPNDYMALTQGQLKKFTVEGVAEMNATLAGGAGTNLNSMVSNWMSDYATNGYNATNIEPSDYAVMNVGQVKYIGNKVWNQLVVGGYTNAVPSWLALNTNSDNQVANLGQIKEVFNFEITTPPSPTGSTVGLSGTSATLSWSESVSGITTFTIEYSTDGGSTWATWTTVSGSLTSTTLTGLTLGTNYQFRVIANNGSGSSAPSSSTTAPFFTLSTPQDAALVP